MPESSRRAVLVLVELAVVAVLAGLAVTGRLAG
ncbi:hypothetical protein CLV35_3536 [Motilibacter peucedani]|uniref:Uncharacterized protein n=1 Tax=Motilibacter peucedani TaxID=598650 RepID=A0A420XL75_9ACTN|nr:hypothetical protein CLV35_3536 [Motilibacter peucedani]